MASGGSDAGAKAEADAVETVGNGRFHVRTSESIHNRKESSNTTGGYRYAVIATILNIGFLVVALAGGHYIVGRFMLVPVFLMMVLLIIAQLLAHFNSTTWRTTTYPIEEYPEVEALIEALSEEMDIEQPTVTIYEKHEPHAKIMPIIGRSHNRMYLTTGLLNQFDDEELSAIIAHELAHIHHSDHYFRTFSAVTQATTMLIGTGIVFITFSNIESLSSDPLGALVSLPLGITVGCLIFVGGWVMNSQYTQVAEFLADSTASDYTSPAAVRQMLLSIAPGDLDENVVEPTPLFEGYPPMQTRIKRMKEKTSDQPSNQS